MAVFLNKITAMKKLLMILLLCLTTAVVAAEFKAELKAEALEGAWLITSMAGMADDEGDLWEFENGLFYQNLGGRRIAPDKYSVMGAKVDLDGYHFTVLELDGKSMKADMAGFVYELTKQ
jgi:hypothetical protein